MSTNPERAPQYHTPQNEIQPPIEKTKEKKNHKVRNRVTAAIAGVAILATIGGFIGKEVFSQSKNAEPPRNVPSTSAPAVPGQATHSSTETAPSTTHEAPKKDPYEIDGTDNVDLTNVVIDAYVKGDDGASYYTGLRSDGQGHDGYVPMTAAGRSSHPDPLETQRWMLEHTITNGMNVGTEVPNASPVAMEFMHTAATQSVGGQSPDLSTYMTNESEQNRAHHTHSEWRNVSKPELFDSAVGHTEAHMTADYVVTDKNGKIVEDTKYDLLTAVTNNSGAWANELWTITQIGN